MPTHKSCEKRLRQDKVRSIHNRDIKNTIRTLRKKLRAANTENKESLLSEYFSKLDKAAKRHIIHKQTANRNKSRMVAFLRREEAATE